MTHPGFTGVSPYQVDAADHRRQIADVLNGAMQGNINVVQTDLTLNDSDTTTTLTDARISYFSFIWLMPKHADAAVALQTVWISDRISGSATINHASDASTDQDFDVLIIG